MGRRHGWDAVRVLGQFWRTCTDNHDWRRVRRTVVWRRHPAFCRSSVKNRKGESMELKLIADISFSDTLGLDVYLPDAQAHPGARPLIMWVHGGGFRPGPGDDKSQSYIVTLSIEFAKRGYVCVSPDYRVRDKSSNDRAGMIADAVQDVDAALSWIRERTDEYGIDRHNTFLAGGSAGGITATILGYTSARQLNGLINLWGNPAPELTESFTYPERPPYFSVHGTADKLIPYENGPALLKNLHEHGIEAELLTIPDGPHTPMRHREEIIEGIQRFIDRHSR
ncbi:MAG: alpha/beta hydrolase [Spirochaetaceae bacterium]|nr:MAG: alpha/beta hydrolase [Spirochaetaceae bacterium]